MMLRQYFQFYCCDGVSIYETSIHSLDYFSVADTSFYSLEMQSIHKKVWETYENNIHTYE